MAVGPESALPVLDQHASGCGGPPRSRRGRTRALVLLGVHVLAFVHIAHWRIAGRTLSALEPSEAGETLTLGYVNAGFVLLVLLLASTLVLGRFFCGWACHVVALQDACSWLLGRVGLRPRALRSRLLAWVPLLAALEMFVLPSVLARLHGEPPAAWRWALATDDFWARFPGPWMAALTFLVVGFLCVWLLGSKGFCTYGCPYGALFGLADRFAPGRIRVDESCEQCGHCTAVCTSNVRVHEEVARFGAVVDPGCMKCMDCVSACPKGALSLGFAPKVVRPPARRKPRREYDLSWGEELLAAAVFLGALYAFRGLYGAVPFLLAVALAVVAALCATALVRLARAPTLRFQHVLLRRDGALTRGGAAALALLLAFLAFAAHSAWVQHEHRSGDAWLARAGAAAPGSPERERALAQSGGHLARALALGLVETAELHNKLGQILVGQGEASAAEPHFLRVVALDPESRSARVYLADLAASRGDWPAALARLEELCALDAADPELARRARSLAARMPDDARVRALVARVDGAAR